MKGFLRSKLALTMTALVMIAAAIALSLSGSAVHFGYAKGQQTEHTLKKQSIPATSVADSFTSPIPSSNVNFTIGYGIQNPNLTGLNGCYWDSTKHQYVPFSQLWHAGEDWFAKTAAGSTSISAVANGVVKYISPSGYSYPGAVIIIQHTLSDNSLVYSMYAHLDPTKILVSVNNTVTKGQAIAGGLVVQKSEGGDNTHLHWEIRYFFDGSGITKGPNYKQTCSAQPGPGYTWPGHPDNFVFQGNTYRWTNPSQFVANHAGQPKLFISGWFNQTTYALQASNGAVFWQTHGGSHSDEAEAFANGVVYVGSDDHFVYALRASDGSQLWSYQTGGIINSPPAVSNGVVYVGSWDGYLYALRASDGSLVWKYLTGGEVHSSPVIQKGVVYFGSGDGSVYALQTSNGSLLWSYRTGGAVYAPPAIANGLVYIGSGDGNLYALQTSNGSPAWSYQTSSALYSGATLNESATVIYVSAGRFLDKLGATTGKLLLSFQVGQQGGAQPAVVNGIIYICSVDSNVYSYRAADGSLIWSFMTAGFMGAKPVLVNGVLYAGGSSGLYALQAHNGAFLWKFSGPVTAPVIETS